MITSPAPFSAAIACQLPPDAELATEQTHRRRIRKRKGNLFVYSQIFIKQAVVGLLSADGTGQPIRTDLYPFDPPPFCIQYSQRRICIRPM